MKLRTPLDLILVIDDNEHDIFFHRRLLKKLNCARRIKVCRDGVEGMDFLLGRGKYQRPGEEWPIPDLIFLDLNMPLMDGWEFLEAFKQQFGERPDTPLVLMVSTSLNPDDQDRLTRYPAVSDFIPKPLDAAHVSKVLAQHFPDHFEGSSQP